MATSVCSKCGASLPAGAKSCPSCGQAVAAAAAAPAPAKLRPAMAIAVLGAGLILVLGAFALFKSGMFSGTSPAGTAAPAADSAAATGAPVAESAPAAGAAVAPAAQPVTIEAQKPVAGASTAPSAPPQPAGVQPVAAPPSLPAAVPTTRTAPAPTPAPGAAAVAPAPATPEPPPPYSKTYECKESAVFNVSPEEAKVTVDGRLIGTADDWDDMGGGKKYEFKGNGTHYVKLTLDEYETLWLRFIVKPEAEDKTADVNLTMEKAKKEKK